MTHIEFTNGYPYRFGDQPVGERPDVSLARSVTELDELRAENAALSLALLAANAERDEALVERDTARALLAGLRGTAR